MTKVYYSVEKMYLEEKGHAGGGPEGQDIICAGISSLTMALLNMLIEHEEKGQIELKWQMAPGYFMIKARPKTEHFIQVVRDYYRVIIIGLKAMEQNNPGNITMEEVR